jgi:hypothetical protein
MFEFQHRQLAHIVRLVIWTCLIATVVILIIPEVSAAGEPSLEFNQSSYEINDTVEVKLRNIGPIPHNQIIVSLFSDEENSTYITEKLHNEGNTSYITQDTVSKLLSSSNQTNIQRRYNLYK